ncbi:MAG: GNAT family N-acetyltransferase [Gammaproteobacteria bacterium]|nr:GNAT family N-acetyltransferase [Gammaproteobacteria bacterium]
MNELHAVSERIQREVLVSMFDACPSDAREALGLRLDSIADVVVSSAEHEPSILLNRAQGLGSHEPVTPQTIEAVVDRYRRYGTRRFFFHVHPGVLPADGEQWLIDAGLIKARGWMQFLRSATSPPAARTDLTVKRVGRDHADAFAAIVCDAFDLAAPSQPYIAAITEDERWHCYMSFDGDTPAGTGAVLTLDNAAYLTFGATAPAFRRRGSQGALMAARIQAAIDHGCEHIFTETGEAVEGEEQVSYRNIERCGFAPQFLCENWTVKPT